MNPTAEMQWRSPLQNCQLSRAILKHPTRAFISTNPTDELITAGLRVTQTGNRIEVVQLRSRRGDDCDSSMAATHNEQSHVVGWQTSLAETGDILQSTVSHGFRSLVTMIPKCANQAV